MCIHVRSVPTTLSPANAQRPPLINSLTYEFEFISFHLITYTYTYIFISTVTLFAYIMLSLKFQENAKISLVKLPRKTMYNF